MLTVSEVLATARREAPDAAIVNRSGHADVPLPEQAGKGPRATAVDVPRVEVAFDGDVHVTFHLDDLDQTRWVGVIRDGDRQVSRTLVAGVGAVAEQIAVARELAGLPEPRRTPQPSHLKFGGQA